MNPQAQGNQVPSVRIARLPVTPPKPSLAARIRVATSPEAVNALLSEGYGYAGASPKAQRSWTVAAEARLRDLSKQPVHSEPAP
jgi:hypothetical protein